jgi:acyl transferase domain-containing protein
MGAELYRREPLFRERIEQCCEFLQQQCQVDLRPYLLPEVDADLDSLAQSLQATSLAQPALFVIEYALAQLWQSWGVEAEALLGHSVGEYVAATLAGVFSWRDALTLVARRGQLIQELPGGCMLAVMGSAQQIEELLDPDLAVAAINGPALSTISGPQIAIQALQSKLDAQGIAWQALKTSHAFHSAMMEPALPAFLKEVKKVGLNCPNRPFLSNVTGRWITTSQATDPHYWTEHVRATVQFEAGLRGLLAAGHDLLLEVGPGEALTRVAGSVLAESTQTQEEAALAVASMPTATSDSTEASVLLRAAGQLWLRGAELDLAQLSEGEPRRRLSLPTYPFERQRYWQSPSPQATAAARQTPETLRKESDVGQWFYAPTWSQSYTTPRNTPQTQAPWLIFTPRAGVLDLLVEQLRSEPAAVYQVYPGEAYQQLDPCSYSIRPANQEDLQRLLQDLQEWPRTLVHGWLVEKDLELKQTLELGYFSLQLLGEVLQERAPTRDFEIFALSSQLQRVTGQEPIDPARATLLGPCRVLPQESPRLKCRSIDLPETPEAGLIDDLQAELLSSSEAHSVALRGGQRWKLVYQQLPLSTGSAQDSLRPRGVYWITGGLGAIGRTIAQALARDLQARLVLTSRRGIGPEHREFAQSLEACGAEVLLASADAGDRQTMTEVAAEARQRFGIIHGVFHAAGVAGAGVQRRSALEGTAEVFTPKLQGTQILYELLDEATDFLLLCSSLSAELGGLGQTDYCAANAFQDRFALQHARQDGPRILSLNWDTWKDHGMAAEAEVPQGLIRRQQETLALGMDAAEGLAVLWRALATNPARVPAQLLISTHDLTRRGAAAPARISATADPRSTEPPAPAPAYSRPKTIGEYAPPQGSAEQRIASIWEALLGVEPIGRDDDFLELGGHSLLATQVLNRLREHDPDLQITLRQMFDQPTVAGMAALLQETATPSDPDPGPLRESLRDCTAKQATPLLESFLQRSIATLLGRTTAPPISEKLPELASGQLSLDLRYQLQAELPFLLHSAELVGHASIASLAAYLSEELQRHLGRKVAPPIGELLFPVRLANDSSKNSFPAERLRPAVFLLSAPRSGSSLLRLMLSAHPSLFCPPELWLLNFDRLRDWHAHAAAALYRDGLAHAWMELHGIDLEGGRRQVQDWLDQDLSTATVYAQLQDRAGHRRLLDKSPAYALHSATLQRARQLFAAPRFLHLTRHPQAVIESFVSSRFHRLVGEDGEARSIAEAYWRRCNQNIHDLSDDLDPAEVHVLKFEDLVQQPESTLQGLCAFLEVEFHPAVLQPYQHGRMRAGPGDPRLLQHSTVVAAKANAWQQRPAAPLSAATRELADVLRYSSHPLSISRESS